MTRSAAGPISPTEAVRRILAEIGPLPPESVPLARAAGRVLAADVTAPLDIPPWDNSAMDGFALRMAHGGWPTGKTGRQSGMTELRVIGTVAAGGFPGATPGPGECVRVFTGAPTPPGCDTVIRQEDITTLPGDRVRIDNWRDAGRNVRPRGGDLRRGDIALARSTQLGPAQIGVLASIAQAEVPVHPRPRVAFLATGDEIAGLSHRTAILEGRKIASSNSYTLKALIEESGGEPVDLGISGDDPADLRRHMEGAAGADMFLTSAGVSVGEHDHVRAVLAERGLQLRFWRIRMRPGAPVGFGMLGSQPWIGLPGNPVSTMVTFELFVRPAIRRMLGHAALFRAAVDVRTGERIELGPRLQHFLRVTLRESGSGPVARLTGPQGSGLLTSMAKADALLIVPEGRRTVRKGARLPAIPLRESRYAEDPPY